MTTFDPFSREFLGRPKGVVVVVDLPPLPSPNYPPGAIVYSRETRRFYASGSDEWVDLRDSDTLRWSGAWDIALRYVAGQTVIYQGGLYLAVADSEGEQPGSGSAWELLATVNDSGYYHVQAAPSAVWVVNHNLGRRPAVIVIDSADTVVYGDVEYTSLDTVTITFSAPFSGSAQFV